MQKKKGFIAYDWFKLVVALLLGLALIYLWISTPCCPKPEVPLVTEVEEVVEAEPIAEAEEASDAEADDTNKDDAEEIETDAAEDADADADMNLPPFPEPSADLEYDATKGGLVNADGELVYTLNEDGSGFTPVIPDDLQTLKLEGEWTLLDEEGNPAYTWDADGRGWVAVPKEEPAEAASTNLVDCPGAAEARLEGGQQAETLHDVNFRSSPGIGENWIGSLFIGDRVKITGETACTPYGNGSYLWWAVERADGKTGWVAEAKINSPSYFLGPLE